MNFIKRNRRLSSTVLIMAILISSFSFWGSTNTLAQESPPGIWHVRAMQADHTDIVRPVGLAFSSGRNSFFTLDAREWSSSRNTVDLIELSLAEDRGAAARIRAAIQDPINVTFDNTGNRLLVLHAQGNQLLEVLADADGTLNPSTLTRYNVVHFGVQDAQGLAVDPASGDLLILDAAGPRLIRVSGGFTNGTVSVVDLQSSGITAPRGIAVEPSSNKIHVLSPAENRLYELTQAGEVIAGRDMTEFGLKDPQGMVFAPSGDSTDDPGRMNLYIADSGSTVSVSAGQTDETAQAEADTIGQIVELSLVAPAALPPGTTLLPATLIRTFDTSNQAWNPSSPDPAGVDFWPLLNRLIIADSEVDEMPAYFTGKNVFIATTAGQLSGTCTTTAFTKEPTGVAVNPINNHLFISSDYQDRVFEIGLGPDGVYCTADDTVTNTSLASLYGITDAEDVAFGNNTLFVGGGDSAEVYRIPLGANGVLGGGDDGAMTHFDTAAWGFNDVEGIGFNWDSGTLFIVSTKRTDKYLGEVSTSGSLLRAYDLSFMPNIGNIRSDVSHAPGSQNPSIKSIYIVSRGVDNDSNRTENDGKVWEIRISGAVSNTPTPSRTPTRTSTPGTGPTPTRTSTPSSTDLIFADGFESGNFSAWSLNKTDAGDLSVTTGAALVSTRGMQAVLDDNTTIFVTDDRPNAEPRYRARFYFDPNSISMVSGNAHYIFNAFQGSSTAAMRVEFGRSSTGYQIRVRLVNDASSWTSSSWFPISDTGHYIEVDWQAATGAGANNGSLTLWIDGAQKASLTGVDNDTLRIDRARLGAVAGLDSGTRGTYYFDAFESRRQTLIGP